VFWNLLQWDVECVCGLCEISGFHSVSGLGWFQRSSVTYQDTVSSNSVPVYHGSWEDYLTNYLQIICIIQSFAIYIISWIPLASQDFHLVLPFTFGAKWSLKPATKPEIFFHPIKGKEVKGYVIVQAQHINNRKYSNSYKISDECRQLYRFCNAKEMRSQFLMSVDMQIF
jgi:hypothetical protein